MKKITKLMAVLLASAMLIAMLSGCSKDNNSSASTESSATESSSEASSAASSEASSSEESSAATNADRENVTIRYAQYGNSIDDPTGMENDPIKKAIEETVNITLEYDTGTDGFDDRMQTELYTGGAAELFMDWGETEKISKWSEDELVYDLAAIVNKEPDRYPYLYKIMNTQEYKSFNKLYTGDENKAYAIYSVFAFASPIFSGVPVYNTAILNEVNGGKVPQTVEEFEDFCAKCGEAGYVGWWPRNDKLTNWGQIDATIALPQGTTICAPNGDFWVGFRPTGTIGTDDEYWKLMTVSDESKEVVKQLAEMYKNGGLDPSIGVKGDFDDAYSDFAAGKIASCDFGFGYPGQFHDFYFKPWQEAHPDTAQPSDLTLGVSLKSNGNYGITYMTGSWVGAHWFIPTTCEYPDRVLDLVEFIASPEGQDLIHNTTDFVYRDDQGLDYWSAIDGAYGYTDRCKYVWFPLLFSTSEYEVNFRDNDWWTAVNNPTDNSSNWSSDLDKQLLDYANGILDDFKYEATEQLPSYYMDVTLPSEAADIRTKLADITNQYLTQMIGGQLDVETAWPDYVAEYEAAGSADLEKMVNDALKAAREEYGQ